MDGIRKSWVLVLLLLSPVFSGAWWEEYNREKRDPDMRRPGVHFHSKRHMLLDKQEKPAEKASTNPKSMIRKKPSSLLSPLHEEDTESDEVSVAIGPPPIRASNKKQKPQQKPESTNPTAANLVKDILLILGKEFLTRDLNENFVFGQYIANAMKKLTKELKLRMQHELLDLVLKYEKLNANEVRIKEKSVEMKQPNKKEIKIEKKEKKGGNDTEEAWPDFSNLAKIVG